MFAKNTINKGATSYIFYLFLAIKKFGEKKMLYTNKNSKYVLSMSIKK